MKNAQDPATPADLTNATLIATDQSIAELDRVAREYADEGYDVFYATAPATGLPALYRGPLA